MDKKDIDAEILASLSGKAKEDFERGLHNMGMTNPADRDDLRTAFKRLKPNATDSELDIMVADETPEDNRKEWIA